MEPKQYLAELESVLEQYRFRDVRALTDQIDPAAFDLSQIKKALSLIRRKRLFADLEHAASLFSMAGREDPVIRRQWCQSLLDQGRVLQALATLNLMSQKHSDDPVEGPEVRGLIGRAYKQLFVNEGNPENLKEAITAYRSDWEHRQGDYRWHGINLVALLSRAKRDDTAMDNALDAAEIAQQIRDDVEELGATGLWDYATSMEAAIAQQDERAILASAKKYIQHPDADAFELASTLRQLKEIWCLEGTPIGNKLLPVLEYAVLQRIRHGSAVLQQSGLTKELVTNAIAQRRRAWYTTTHHAFLGMVVTTPSSACLITKSQSSVCSSRTWMALDAR